MERTLDAKGRWRNRTVGFRVSEEEAKMIDRMVMGKSRVMKIYVEGVKEEFMLSLGSPNRSTS